MATPRVRNQTYPPTLGTYQSQGGSISNYSRANGSDYSEDMIDGFDTDNRFLLTRDRRSGGQLNGTRLPGLFGPRIWNNVPAQPDHGAGTSVQFFEAEDSAKIRGFNLANPGRPQMLLPVSVKEFGDIPRMVRQGGDTMRFIVNGIRRPPNTIASGLNTAKKIAADNLAYQFGWAPFLSDLKGMALMTDSVNKRRKEMERLFRGKGLKRRITLDKREVYFNQTGTQTVWSTDGSLLQFPKSQIKRRDFVHRWATYRFVPTGDTPLPSDDQAIRMMLMGLTTNALASNLWEAIPWTWLVDWFTNLGDIVARYNNSAFVRLTSCCLMSHSGAEISVPAQLWDYGGGSSIRMEAYKADYVTKRRSVGMPAWPMPEITLPLLGGGQLSILGSLAVVRMGK